MTPQALALGHYYLGTLLRPVMAVIVHPIAPASLRNQGHLLPNASTLRGCAIHSCATTAPLGGASSNFQLPSLSLSGPTVRVCTATLTCTISSLATSLSTHHYVGIVAASFRWHPEIATYALTFQTIGLNLAPTAAQARPRRLAYGSGYRIPSTRSTCQKPATALSLVCLLRAASSPRCTCPCRWCCLYASR